jgi:hypothetical protein
MQKRGQVTIFIILGIVIVAVLAFVFFIGDISFKEDLTAEEAERFVSSRIEPISVLVEGCVEQTAFDVLKNMGRQGGRIIPRARYYDVPLIGGGSSLIDYSLIKVNGEYMNYDPSLAAMEAEFETFLNSVALDPGFPSGISGCIDDFKNFEREFDNIDTGDMSIDVEFGKKVLLKISYPVTLRRSSYETTLEDYYTEIPIDMGEIHQVSSRLINEIISGGDYLDVVSDLANTYESELNANLREDIIRARSDHYVIDAVAEFNNRNNILFTLEYTHPELTQDYLFKFLTGTG